MIDLTKRTLPNTITVDGKVFSINTDFRVWLRFERELKEKQRDPKMIMKVDYLFLDDCPVYCDISALIAFARPQNELPRQIGGGSQEIAMDYDIDADLIYSAFMTQYGMDLLEVKELHWWKFLALLGGLNSSTQLHEVIGYRMYDGSEKKPEDVYSQLKEMWRIESQLTAEDQAELDELNSYFD